MALDEIEFELPFEQFELMGYPALRQGQALNVQLDTVVVSPDSSEESWYGVQPEALPPSFQRVGRSQYAFAGQITEADIVTLEEITSAVVLTMCGETPLRVFCAPDESGQLPYGTWETRYIFGVSHLRGIIEDDFSVPIGRTVDVTIWSFRRLVLRPGDAQFGRWYETTELPPTPYLYDRVTVVAKVHRAMKW